MNTGITGTIVKKFLKQYPKTSHNQLAKIIYKKHEADFSDTEHVRSIIRYYKGSSGYQNRLALNKLSYENKLSLPISDEMEMEPVILEYKKTLLLPDVHVPYHSIEALNTCLSYGLEYKPDCILLYGDFIDMYQVSYFGKDPDMRSVKGEIELTKQLLNKIVELFPKTAIVWQFGNHEDRYDKYLMQNAPALYNLDEMRLDFLFRDYNITFVKHKRRIKIGKLDIIHGHELGRGIFSPVNPARGLWLRTGKTSMCGHSHRTSEHTETRLNGDIVSCWSAGCLCNLNPDYSPYSKWNHGFTTVDLVDKIGNFKVDNYRIYKGEIL